MIYGECEHAGIPVLNIRWPHRVVWKVCGVTEGGENVEVYVLDDCSGDAVESVLDWAGEEGSDDSAIDVTQVIGDEREKVLCAVDAANADKAKE
jgi:hypothetical protein